MAKEITIQSLDPNTFEFQTYSEVDTDLIVQSQLDTVFSNDTDYIEYYIYDQNQNLIFPSTTTQLLNYDVREGDVVLTPSENLSSLGYNLGIYNILYTFYRKRLASNISEKYFISNISSDRTEIRLDSNIISNDLIISSSNNFIEYRENAEFFVDFYLNFGDNQTVIANNIKLETEENIDPTILIKLYEPLPDNFGLKDELWVVEELSLPQAYQLNFPFEPIIEDDFTYISGPNYNINVTQETSTGGESISFSTLLQSNLTSSVNQLKNILDKKEVNININYENYSNFINFSSAKTRLENFYYKVGLIESYNTQLGQLDLTTGDTIFTPSFSSSRLSVKSKIDDIIKNFDGYESFLYYNSGSLYSYPKQNVNPPFKLYSTGSTEVLNWIGSADPNNVYYGGQALSASNFDVDNRDSLFYSIPEYLREDPANQGYELFVDMVGQYYDNVWVYTKDISNKFDADNRLEFGISKDLVADAIRDFGVKLYASNFNTNDLFTAFLGLTTTGSLFPFPNITGSLPTETGYEYVNTQISASNDVVPLNNVQKQLYKRIYHNIPYLLKTKGTVAGLRALITSYGIPDTILRVNEFGGKDKNEYRDYDLKQNVFNFGFDTTDIRGFPGDATQNYLTSSFELNPSWNSGFISGSPETVQFRFKSAALDPPFNNEISPFTRYSQSLFVTCTGSVGFLDFSTTSSALILEYTGSGFTSASYSGSTVSSFYNYGTLKFYPDLIHNPTVSCSVFAPFFNEDWWSVQLNVTGSGTSNATATLFSANEIDGKIGFFSSDTKTGLDSRSWGGSKNASLNYPSSSIVVNNKTYKNFSGSFQEYRMFSPTVSESKFLDYVVNPYSAEGNGINSTPNELAFRAPLGSQLNTASRISIHPRITGSTSQITQSFSSNSGSSFFLSTGSSIAFSTNTEFIYQDQTPAGIKNRVTDKIQAEGLVLAEAPYGFQTPSSSIATISSTTSNVISPLKSIQQHSYVSQSYTPNIDYLEVAFSPSNQINDDINAQLGYFNLGEYIGDPRFISSSDRSYPNLDILRDAYFEKYIRGYDIKDFVRLIKFFDNSLFKMIKDFTPARTSLASGVVVKQHLLERNRQRPALASSSLHNYSGTVVNLPKNYNSGSLDFPQYSTSGSAIYKFGGGPGGSFNRFNSLNTSPSGSNGTGPNNRYYLTQSWSESFDHGAIDRSIINPLYFNQSSSQYISASYLGRRTGIIHSDQSEFYNGIFSGSYIEVTNQNLNPDCEPYLNVADTDIIYKTIYYCFNSELQGSVNANTFIDNNNVPPSGYAWIGSSLDNVNNVKINPGTQFSYNSDQVNSTVKFIKLAAIDANGVQVADYIQQNSVITINGADYFIEGVVNYGNHVLLNIDHTQQDSFVTGSASGGQEDFTVVDARGNYSASSNSILTSQNIFELPIVSQTQFITYWANGQTTNVGNVPTQDVQGFFNTGSKNVSSFDILTNPNGESGGTTLSKFGGFNILKTPNTPLFFSCSVAFSASNTGLGSFVTMSGNYHSASFNGGNAKDQGFILTTNAPSNVYIPAPFISNNLNNAFFSTNLNNLIPGNSASWYPNYGHNPANSSDKPNLQPLEGAGHRQIIFPGTSSFDFHFPSFTFNQQTSLRGRYSTQLTSLSGSGANGSNQDFNYATAGVRGGITVNGSDTAGEINIGNIGTDGAVGIPLEWISRNYNGLVYNNFDSEGDNNDSDFDFRFPLGPGGPRDIPANGRLNSVQVIIQYTLIAPTGTDISCSAFTFSTKDGATGTDPEATLARGLDGFNNQNLTRLAQARGTTPVDVSGIIDAPSDFGPIGGTFFTNYGLESGSTGQWPFTASFTSDQFKDESGDNIFEGQSLGTLDDAINSTTTALQKHIAFIKPAVKGTATTVQYGFRNLKIMLRAGVENNNGTRGTLTTDIYSDLEDIQEPPFYDALNWIVTPGSENPIGPNFLGAGVFGHQGATKVNNIVILLNDVANQLLGSRVQVNAQLWKLSGSADASDSSNTGSEFQPQLITQSLPVTYDLNLGAGFGPNSNFTETVTFPDSPILNILHPYHNGNWPDRSGQPNGSTINEAGDIYFVQYSMSNYEPGLGISTGIPVESRINFNVTDDTNKVALPQVVNNQTKLIISQSVKDPTGAFSFVTASISVFRGDPDTSMIQDRIVNEQAFQFNSATTTGTALVTGSIDLFELNYTLEDTFRMAVEVSKSFDLGVTITEYSMSIFNSGSRWSPFDVTSRMNNGNLRNEANNFRIPLNVATIVQTYYGSNILPFDLALDCQPLLNNFVNQRPSSHYMDIDYNYQTTGSFIHYSNSLAPVNYVQIMSGSAVSAAIPDSNYTILGSINPRYLGSKSTSLRLNTWNPGDEGTYGKLPTVELRDALFGYFNDLDDPYPIINGLTRINLNYLIDEQSNALPPSLDPISINTFNQVFPKGTSTKLAAQSGKNNFKELGVLSNIERSMEYLTPIMYSQVSGDNYTNAIPLSGSGYVFRYDVDNPNSPIFIGFNALGGTSFDTSLPLENVEFTLDPTASVSPSATRPQPTMSFTMNPYQEGNMSGATGAIFYSASNSNPSFRPGGITSREINDKLGVNGEELGFVPGVGITSSAQQIVTLSHTFVTSFVSETRGSRNELFFSLQLYTGSSTARDPSTAIDFTTGIPFNLQDITCKVHTDQGQAFDIGSVLDYSWLEINSNSTGGGFNPSNLISNNIYNSTATGISKKGLRVTVDWEMYYTLFDLGLMRELKPRGGSGVTALEWTIKANTGNYGIKVGDVLRWRFKGSFKKSAKNYRQGFFFPNNYDGSMVSTNIQGIGAHDYLLSTANTASAPFWTFSGSIGGDNLIKDPQFLVMSASNLNEAYGTTFKQADLEYIPGPSDYFPFGIEPSNTQFETIKYPLELKEGDEIRFGNNENFTYKITQVIPPESNLDPGDHGSRIKIKLNRPVSSTINKDFFLIRRSIPNPNSIYLNNPFPYDTLASASLKQSIRDFTGSLGLSGSLNNLGGNTGSAGTIAGTLSGSFTGSFSDLEISTTPGILYPKFPTEYLVQSASKIVNDLISKGIIES